MSDQEVYLFFFFFSSRRRHTRYIGDWSSDVCSSDLDGRDARRAVAAHTAESHLHHPAVDAAHLHRRPVHLQGRSEERRVGKSVDLGGRRIIKKKKEEERGSSQRHTRETHIVYSWKRD